MTNHAVDVKNLKKDYGKITAVSNVSFQVKPREIFALIGPNGAGKTTILRILATLLNPTGGKVSIYGHDVVKEPKVARTLITYLPEEAGTYKNMTGITYLKFMAGMYLDSASDRREAIARAREIVDLGNRLKDKISTYSKGMVRKLLLARTVMTKPKLAILDEPTSGLDVVNALSIRETIRNLSKEGMAVILSSHNMLEIEYLSNRVALMNHGKIIESGKPDELKKKYGAHNLEEVFAKLTSHHPTTA
ncbi:MAG: ABC transporter ATP-binding protein [Candidatus Dojkabacteria bacterium]|nr:ABC transporter ATP-binding protein [Candidatus Dojkabacteria bacterium]